LVFDVGSGLRDTKDLKKVRSRQKLPVSGPRVKHVCRSASLVLGQPIATFNQSNNKNGNINYKITFTFIFIINFTLYYIFLNFLASSEVKKPKSEEVSSVKQLR
jgi:hypothetical protein